MPLTRYAKVLQKAVAREWSAPKVSQVLGEDAPSLRKIQVDLKRAREGREPLKKREAKSKLDDTFEIKGDEENQSLELYSTRVVTLDDALKKAKVDETRWEVDWFKINSWEVGAKGPDKIIRVTPLWKVEAKIKRKKGWSVDEFRKLLLEDVKKAAKPPKPASSRRVGIDAPLLGEVSIFDAHFGKLAWAPEAGEDYDLGICRDRYVSAGMDLLQRLSELKVDRILFVVGNDFFHADHKTATHSGTMMDVDGRWQKAFRIGVEACRMLIGYAQEMAPIDVECVSGNHDMEKLFCLGEVLGGYYHRSKSVNVTNTPSVYSYYEWGRGVIGFNHGDKYTSERARQKLPHIMLRDKRRAVANSLWREWHLGHIHSETEEVWKYRSVEQVDTTSIRYLPSLSATDAWHRENGYASPIAAEAFVFHKELGRRNILSHCPKESSR